MTARAARPFDVVLFGATGYTGRLVAERLARAAAARPLKWALAGRDKAKLEKVRDELAAQVPAAKDLAIRVVDAHDAAGLAKIAAETRCICTTVGPYLKYGAEVVAACAAAGTDYCDLTGESPFIRAMIDAHHEEAQRTGARIVHCCGFDSIPADLGVLYLQQEMLRRHGRPASRVTSLVSFRGGPSGGTMASMMEIMDRVTKDRRVRSVMGNPYGLDPDPKRRGPDVGDAKFIGYDARVGALTAPFIMAAVNTRVVRRSHALMGRPYGDGFRYEEVMELPATPKGLSKALQATLMQVGLGLSAVVPALRTQLQKRMPKPGEGPTPEQRERGFFVYRLVGEVEGEPSMRMIARVADKGDPGYASTSRMLSEAAICLATDGLPSGGGVLTPASSMGMALVERLRHTGMTFEIEA